MLPSGSLRVRVVVGADPSSDRRLPLNEIIPAGPDPANLAEKPAYGCQLLDPYFKWLMAEPNTKENYEALARNHIRPLIGDQPVGRMDGERLDSFYDELRTCRANAGVATELISAGVYVTTVDQRAAGTLAVSLPMRPVIAERRSIVTPSDNSDGGRRAYMRRKSFVAHLSLVRNCQLLRFASRHDVAFNVAQRGVEQLKSEGVGLRGPWLTCASALVRSHRSNELAV